MNPKEPCALPPSPTDTEATGRRPGPAAVRLAAVPLVLLFLVSSGLGLAGTVSPGHAVPPSQGGSYGSGPSHAAPPAHAASASVNSLIARALPANSGLSLASAPFLRSAVGGPVGPPMARPLGASTPSNWYVTNYGWLEGAAAIGGSSTNLLAAGNDYGPQTNYSTGSTFVLSHGIIGLSRSANGGASWNTEWPGQATAWTTTGSPSYGDVLDSALNFGTGYNLLGGGFELWNSIPSAFPAVASDATGADLLAAAPFNSNCFITGAAACFGSAAQSNATYKTEAGVGVVRSVNGGVTWGAPVPILSMAPYRPVYYSNGCTNSPGTGVLLLPANQTMGFALAMGGPTAPAGKNYAYLAIDVMKIATKPSGWFCSANGYLQISFKSMDFVLEIATSADGGATWGAPAVAADANFPVSFLVNQSFPIAPLLLAPHITVGPAPTYTVHVAYLDVANISTAQLFPIAAFTNATATTWNAPADIGISSYAPDSSAPVWFFNGTIPMITADNWTSSPHKGNLYLVWNDNRTSMPGTPSILFSANAGTSWSNPLVIASGGGLRYFNPSVSVQSNGTIWVVYYGVTPSSGYYRLYGVYSTDGGLTWSGQFPITDQASTPYKAPSQQYALGVGAVAATSAGAYAFWSDCRSGNCQATSGYFNWTIFAALVHPVSIRASVANITAQVTLGGAVANYALPARVGWDTNANVTVGVSSWVANGSNIDEFASFSGAVSSTTDPVTFSYASGNLVAHYVSLPGSWIAGTVRPMVVGASVTVTGATGTIAATLAPRSGNWAFNVTVPGGSAYTVTASAPKYQPNSTTVPTTQFKTVTINFALPRILGWIAGTVQVGAWAGAATGATLKVNDTAISSVSQFNRTTGRFNVTVAWGTYYVNVSAAGYLATPASSYVTVFPGVTTPVTPALQGSWLNGTVTPASGVVVRAGSLVVPLALQGTYATFNFPLPGSTYAITAHRVGYSYYNLSYTILPGTARTVSIVLTNRGYITGLVTPATFQGHQASVLVSGVSVTVSNGGVYNSSQVYQSAATLYPIEVSLFGHKSAFANVSIAAGNGTWQNFSLAPGGGGGGGGGGTNCTVTHNCTTTAPAQLQGFPILGIVGIGVAVVLVAAIASVLLLRRGRGGTGDEAPTEEAEAEGPEPTDAVAESGGSPPSNL